MKLSKFLSIVFLTAIVTVVAGGFFVTSVVNAEAQEPTVTTDEVEVVEVDPEDVPDVGSFGDVLLRIRERFEEITAGTDERRVELEEKFAARREAQLERLEALPDDHPQKANLISRLQERHDKHLANIAERVDRLSDKKAEILEKLEEHSDRFEARRERVLERQAERGEKTQDLKDKIEQRKLQREESGDLRDSAGFGSSVRDTVRPDAAGTLRRTNLRERQETNEKALDARNDRARDAFKNRVNGVASLKLEDTGVVRGAMDYAPESFLETIGQWLGSVGM